jgi:hypothetical protein
MTATVLVAALALTIVPLQSAAQNKANVGSRQTPSPPTFNATPAPKVPFTGQNTPSTPKAKFAREKALPPSNKLQKQSHVITPAAKKALCEKKCQGNFSKKLCVHACLNNPQ